ncbi:zf-HC2 domain-containing protein [Mycolicibacterium goodii]|uniref:zf-HC2 domain-containing protein n=1 Tax=Mycolicibacterium goodii TaxID=134601 RepID=UPI0027DF3C09|nr:zf-HC2 domain-containing protein [Mycolicibacterium goodii]
MNPLDCNELVEIVTAYLDGSLDLETRARFDEHLLECDGCDNYLQQFRVTISTVGRTVKASWHRNSARNYLRLSRIGGDALLQPQSATCGPNEAVPAPGKHARSCGDGATVVGRRYLTRASACEGRSGLRPE